MSVTVQDVFDIAMGLMDEINSSGSSDTSDTSEYKNRTIRILNTLQLELYPLSDTYTIVTSGKRPVCAVLTVLAGTIDLDDYLARTVMPYGLAAALLIDENPASASFFQQRYEELKAAAKNIPSAFEAIEDVYGITDYSTNSEY